MAMMLSLLLLATLTAHVTHSLTTEGLAAGTSLQCTDYGFLVLMDYDLAMSGANGETIELYIGSDSDCTYTDTDTPVIYLDDSGGFVFNFTYPACNATRSFIGSTLAYDAVVGRRASFGDPQPGQVLITRVQNFNLDVSCIYDLSGTVVSTSFMAAGEDITDDLVSDGILSLRIDVYKYSDYGVRYTEFPVYVSFGKLLYFEITQDLGSTEDLHLVAENCSLTSTNNPDDPIRQELLTDRCVVAPDFFTELASPSADKVRFSIPATGFLDENDATYLWCTVIVCDAGDAASRCNLDPVCDGGRARRSPPALVPVDRYKSRERVSVGRIIVLDTNNQQETVGVIEAIPPAGQVAIVTGGSVAGAVGGALAVAGATGEVPAGCWQGTA